MKYQNKKSVCIIVLLLLFAAGCILITACDNIIIPAELLRQPDPEVPGDSTPEPEDPIPEDPVDPVLTDINEMLRARPDISQPAETGIIMQGIVDDSDPSCPSPLEGYENTFKKYSAAVGFYQHTCLDPQSDIIWPGSIIDGDSIMDGEYVPLTLKRGPLSFSIKLSDTDEQFSGFMEEAKISQEREQVGSLVTRDMLESVDSDPNFNICDIYSENQLYLAMEVHFPGYAFDPATLFRFENQGIRTRKLVTFSQAYYTVNVDMPETPAAFFGPEVLWEDIEAQLHGDSSPVYISSVTYGKMAYFAIESSASPEELNAALYYAWTGIPGNGDPEIESEYMEILNNATINAVILGGNGNTTVQGVAGFDDFLEWISSSGDFFDTVPDAPLAYKLRYLSDNQVAKIVVRSDYYVRECEKIYTRYRLYINKIEMKLTPELLLQGTLSSGIGYSDTGDVRIEEQGAYSLNNDETIINKSLDYFFDINKVESAYIKVLYPNGNITGVKLVYLADIDSWGEDGSGYYYCNFDHMGGLFDTYIGSVKFSIMPIK